MPIKPNKSGLYRLRKTLLEAGFGKGRSLLRAVNSLAGAKSDGDEEFVEN